MPDTDSDPVVSKFYVQYKEVRSGQLYNTIYTRIQIEMGTPATSEPVSRAYAGPLCAGN